MSIIFEIWPKEFLIYVLIATTIIGFPMIIPENEAIVIHKCSVIDWVCPGTFVAGSWGTKLNIYRGF